jgi:hypothetical protein
VTSAVAHKRVVDRRSNRTRKIAIAVAHRQIDPIAPAKIAIAFVRRKLESIAVNSNLNRSQSQSQSQSDADSQIESHTQPTITFIRRKTALTSIAHHSSNHVQRLYSRSRTQP